MMLIEKTSVLHSLRSFITIRIDFILQEQVDKHEGDRKNDSTAALSMIFIIPDEVVSKLRTHPRCSHTRGM